METNVSEANSTQGKAESNFPVEQVTFTLNPQNAMGLLILLENVLTLVILYRSEKLVYQVRTLTMALTTSDCLFGIGVAVPKKAVGAIMRCNIFTYFLTISFYSSVLTATIINFDRCISMYFPMKYKIVITNTRLKLICVGQFVLAVAFTMIQFNVPIQSSGFYCGDYVSGNTTLAGRTISRTLMLVNIIPYLLMLWYLKKRRQIVDVVGNAATDNSIGKITLISSFLFICYAPVIILSDVQSNFPACTAVGIAVIVFEFLALINSVLNPVLYAWRFYEVRYQFLRLICFWNSRKMDVLHQRRQQHFATFEINTRQVAVQRSPDEYCT